MSLQLRSLIRRTGELELSLVEVPVPVPQDDEVVVQVQAAPINPSDLALLLGPADLATLAVSGTPERPVVHARVPERALPALTARLDESMPTGNEGAGLVVAAGASPAAQALLGRTVGFVGGAAYAQHRAVNVVQCLPLPDGTSAREGAAWFVNPFTALGMVETMRREKHTALVHTAAASNLGQMLHRICLEDGVPLVNIVRRPEQATLLKGLGAAWVVDSSAPTFMTDLTEALVSTGATLAFDATGGGTLAAQILTAMEAAITRSASTYNRYGSSTHKQVYVYGRLDPRPLELSMTFGFAWGVSGWLLTPFLAGLAPADMQRLRQRVASNLKTTFASQYTKAVSLVEALRPDVIAAYAKKATGEKYLIVPA